MCKRLVEIIFSQINLLIRYLQTHPRFRNYSKKVRFYSSLHCVVESKHPLPETPWFWLWVVKKYACGSFLTWVQSP